jgi:alpha-glucosidase (family GH31 glycosyl hydrolase)
MYSADVKKGPGRKTFPVDLDTVPAYQRAGTVLALQMRPRRNSILMAADPYTLRVAIDSQVREAVY